MNGRRARALRKALGFKPYAHFSYDIQHSVTEPKRKRPARSFQIHRCTGKRVAYQAAKLERVDATARRAASGRARRRTRKALRVWEDALVAAREAE